MEVPLSLAVAALLENHADVMPWPGANRSTQAPRLENDARASTLVLAPTVRAWPTRAGESLHASALSLPAAIAYTTPAAIELRTATSSALEITPPRLMFATAGFT